MAARFGDVLYWAYSGLAFLVIAVVEYEFVRAVIKSSLHHGLRVLTHFNAMHPAAV